MPFVVRIFKMHCFDSLTEKAFATSIPLQLKDIVSKAPWATNFDDVFQFSFSRQKVSILYRVINTVKLKIKMHFSLHHGNVLHDWHPDVFDSVKFTVFNFFCFYFFFERTSVDRYNIVCTHNSTFTVYTQKLCLFFFSSSSSLFFFLNTYT